MEDVKYYSDTVLSEAREILKGEETDGATNIVCLGQSDNSKGIMFVLYQHIIFDGIRDTMKFRAILSNDLLDACKKARFLCGDAKIELYDDINQERVSIKLRVERILNRYPDLGEKLESTNHIIQDIKRYLHKKGRISSAQIELVNKIHLETIKRNEMLDKYKGLEAHYFNDKDRVEVTIDGIIDKSGYATHWGYTSIIKYATTCGKVVMYSGTSPTELTSGDRIRATIKHNVYKDTNQTLIQRITVVK